MAQLESPSEQATVPAGQFTASKISVRIFDHGQEVNATRFTIWLAQDAARTPVLVETELPIGTARLEMTAELIGSKRLIRTFARLLRGGVRSLPPRVASNSRVERRRARNAGRAW